MQSTLFAIARPSVRLSVRHTGESLKTVEVRIMQLSPQNSPITSFYGIRLIPKFSRVQSLWAGAPNKGGVEKQAI